MITPVVLRVILAAPAPVVVPFVVVVRRIGVLTAAVVVPFVVVVRRIGVLTAAVVVPFVVVRRIGVLTAAVVMPFAAVWRIAALVAAVAAPRAVVRRIAEELLLAMAMRIVVVLRVIARRDARRVRARGLAGHEPQGPFVAMTKVLGAAHRPLRDEASSVEVKTPGNHGGPLSTDRLHPEVGVGSRRFSSTMILGAKNSISRLTVTPRLHRVMLTDVASAARKESGFRRRFRVPALRLVARLKNGFALGASLSTANSRFSVFASGRLIMCGSMVA